MKVLMLGWEFPPHISGGLGTACHGLTSGLSRAGVDVVFAVPRAFGDEHARHLRLVGANQVRFPRWRWIPGEPPRPGEPERRAEHPTSAPLPPALARAQTPSEEARLEPGTSWSWLAPLSDPSDRTGEGTASSALVEPPASAYQDPGTPGALPLDFLAWLEGSDSDGGLAADGALDFGGLGAQVPRDKEGWRALAPRIRQVLERRRAATERPPPAPSADGRWAFDWVGLDFAGGYGGDLYGQVSRYALAVGEIARRESFDVIHAHDWMTIPAAAAAAEVSGKPVVLHVHASEYDRSGEHPNLFVKGIEQLGLDIASRVICVSHYTAGILRRRYRVDPAKVRVVHNAVTQEEQKREWRGSRHISEPIVLFLGRITFQKGPDYFLEAAARVVKLRPDVVFVVSGSGDMLPGIIERSARLGLARNLFFTGFLRGKDVERMYSMADLYVMPSVSEPFGITPLEAMALDVPVIVSRQSGVSEILTHALKVDFWDVDELANKILAVLEYGPLRSSLVESGRDEVRRMRWELRGELVRNIYHEVLR